MLLCHYGAIKKCSHDTKRVYSLRKTLVSSLPTCSGILALVVQNMLTKNSITGDEDIELWQWHVGLICHHSQFSTQSVIDHHLAKDGTVGNDVSRYT